MTSPPSATPTSQFVGASTTSTTAVSASSIPKKGVVVHQRDMKRLYSSLVAGVGSGALASVICAPIDLIRTRLQVWTEVKHSPSAAIPQMLRDIIKRDGIAGCFRGLGATLVTVPAFWGVYWPLYDDCKRRWSVEYPDVNPMWIHMGSAISAGVVSDIICNPMFVVRTRLQTEALHSMGSGPQAKLSMIQTARALYQEGGPFIFWRGMTANLMGLSHVGVQFPVYEQLKKTLRKHKKQESALDLLLASGLSKMTACILTYPHEVIRSRMMDARTRVGFIETCQRIYAGEGAAGFYAGLPITLMRVIPNTCIVSFET
eukprot:scaffold2765_cov165-Amphora_coffeaeformis.AAC.7